MIVFVGFVVAFVCGEMLKSIVMPNLLLPFVERATFSQCGQDYLVSKLIDRAPRQARFYVDLAANDPVKISNTYLLDRSFGWSGVCIEANPQYWYGLAMHRTCKVVGAAVGDLDNQVSKFVLAGATGSIIGFDKKAGATTDVPTLSLLTIFRHLGVPKTITYMSLDVEGAEYFIMKRFPFSLYEFSILTVERPGAELTALLRSHAYVFVGATAFFGDQLWLSRTFVENVWNGTAPTIDLLLRGFAGKRCI